MILPEGVQLCTLVQFGFEELEREGGKVVCCKGKEDKENEMNHGFG